MWGGSHPDTFLQHIKHYPELDRVKQRPGASAWCTEAESSGTETNGRCSEPRTGSWNQMHVAETKKGRRNQQAQARARQTLLCIAQLLGAIAWSCCLGHVLGAKAGITRGGKRGERTPLGSIERSTSPTRSPDSVPLGAFGITPVTTWRGIAVAVVM